MKRFTRYMLVALLGVAATACDDKLDIAQHGVLNYETYYQTDEEAESGAVALYLEGRGIGMNYILGKNMLTDDVWAGGANRADNAELEQLNEFTFGTDLSYLQGMFESYYKIIYKANVLLGHVSDETPIKQRVLAEAKVFRAWAYFELISMWGNPPLVDHELLPEEYSQPNGSREELWALVEKDLTEAIESNTLEEKANADDKSVWHVTKQFAQAMLGKAYLWQGKNKEAAAMFDKVVESKLYRLYEGNYGDILSWHNKMNCESMCEFARVDDKENIFDNFDMTYTMLGWRSDHLDVDDPSLFNTNGGWGFIVPQKSLYDTFVQVEGVDGYRLNQSILTYEQVQAMGVRVKMGMTMMSEGYFNWKMRYEPEADGMPGFNGMIHTQNMRLMRYAEVLLLGAEAHLAAGNSSKAAEYFNQIRDRAKLPRKSAITLNDIILEKRCELCYEGTRYQDMIRWGIAYDCLKDQGKYCPTLDSNGHVTYKAYNQDPSKFGFKKGKHELLPYPGAEMRLNPNINQNPGW